MSSLIIFKQVSSEATACTDGRNGINSLLRRQKYDDVIEAAISTACLSLSHCPPIIRLMNTAGVGCDKFNFHTLKMSSSQSGSTCWIASMSSVKCAAEKMVTSRSLFAVFILAIAAQKRTWGLVSSSANRTESVPY